MRHEHYRRNRRTAGWAAIYEAVTTAGLVITAAYPIHAELRAAGEHPPDGWDNSFTCWPIGN